ncbi:MAG: hypothetical protein RXN31_02105 [Candidatus Nanopusillus acidilobi]
MKTSLAPLALLIGVIILTLFGIYYLNSQMKLSTQSLKYLSEDYIAYQGFLYLLFVYIPFDIRYNLTNNLLTNIFYPVYNQGYVFENSIPYYYYSCEIPFLFYLGIKYNINSNSIIYPVYSIGNNYYINYSLCVPIIPLNNLSDINNNIFYSVANTVEQNLNEEIEILNFKYANFSYQDFYYDSSINSFVLSNPKYSFFVLSKYERNLSFPQLNNRIDYSVYPFLLYYNELIDYLYNRTFQFIYYNLTNQSDYTYLYQNSYYNETVGDNLYLDLSFNNTYYYVLDLYTSQLMPPGYPGITNVTIVIPCESVGQIVNNQCIINDTYSEYMNECLYSNINNILSNYNHIILNKENIFNGYWYNITSTNITNEENVEVNRSFVENILENYTYYTDGYYLALIPVDLQINYSNVSCSIYNETLLFGPYDTYSDCSSAQDYLSNLCTIEHTCYSVNVHGYSGVYFFNAICLVPETSINNQFTYNYYLYEFVEINNETINDYCDDSYCYIIG